MTTTDIEYPHKHHDWHGSAVDRQSFYLTGLKSETKDYKGVLLKAIVTLRNADFVGLLEDMDRTVLMLKCALGIENLQIPKANVGTYDKAKSTNTSLHDRIARLNRVDKELYAFGRELFEVRWADMAVLRTSGFEYC